MNIEVKELVLTYAGLPLCWKAFLENTTPHQQHVANSIQKSPGNHLLEW